MENLSKGKDINRAWENIKEIIRTSAKESKIKILRTCIGTSMILKRVTSVELIE